MKNSFCNNFPTSFSLMFWGLPRSSPVGTPPSNTACKLSCNFEYGSIKWIFPLECRFFSPFRFFFFSFSNANSLCAEIPFSSVTPLCPYVKRSFPRIFTCFVMKNAFPPFLARKSVALPPGDIFVKRLGLPAWNFTCFFVATLALVLSFSLEVLTAVRSHPHLAFPLLGLIPLFQLLAGGLVLPPVFLLNTPSNSSPR